MGYRCSRITGELSGIIVHDGDASRIEADHTVLTGGLIANAVRDADGQLLDQGRLTFVTRTLETHDLADSSDSDQRGFNLGLSLNLQADKDLKAGATDAAKASTFADGPQGGNTADKSSRLQPGTLTIGATHTGHRMEGMTFATIGAGDVQVLSDAVSGRDSLAGVNRDVTNMQIITLDQDTRGLDASLSVDLRLLTPGGRAQIAEEQKNMGRNYQLMGDAVGEGVHVGIETAVLLVEPTEKGRTIAADIESLIGTFGVIPTSLNNGGVAFGQIPVLLKARDINQRQMVAASRDGDFMKAHPELNWVPMSETEGFYLLPTERRDELRNFMVATVSAELIASDRSLATYQNATTGMLNTEALALYNAFTQTGTNKRADNAAFTLNYNPTREFFADGLESFVDKLATSNLFGILDTARPLSFLSTSVAEDTGDYLRSVMLARGDQGANFACHSQGCLLTYSGILSQDGFSTLDKIGEDRTLNFEFNMYGSAVNNVSFHNYLDSKDMLLRSSTVNKHDYVGQSLGENRGTYIYNENDTNRPFEQQVSASQFNIVRDTANKLNLINLGWLFLSSSPHSNYTCTANCGDERK